MTPKERVKLAFEFKPADHTPSMILEGGVWITQQTGYSLDGFLDLPDNGAGILWDYYNKLGSDVVWGAAGLMGVYLRAMGAKSNFSQVGKSAEVLPLSDDTEFFRTIDPDSIEGILRNDPVVQKTMSQVRNLKKLAGDEKYVAAMSTGPFTFAGQMLGVQNLMVALMEDDDDIDLEPLFTVAEKISVVSSNMLTEAGVDILFIGDPVASGALIGQDTFEELALPMLKKAIAQYKCEKLALHICGDTTPRIPSLVGSGIDAFSVDSVDIAASMEAAKGDYVIIGNLSPFDVMVNMSAEEVKQLAIQRCKEAGGNKGGFILAPGCDLANPTPEENCKMLYEAVIA